MAEVLGYVCTHGYSQIQIIGIEYLGEEKTLSLKCQTGPPFLPLYKKSCIIKISILYIRVAIPMCMLNLFKFNLVYSEHKTKCIAAAQL
jgi:hypothetical protein